MIRIIEVGGGDGDGDVSEVIDGKDFFWTWHRFDGRRVSQGGIACSGVQIGKWVCGVGVPIWGSCPLK